MTKTPKEIKKYLDTFVVSHNTAKKALSTALFIQAKKLSSDLPEGSYPSQHSLVIGGTGTGKSYMISKLAESYGLPLITIDCSQLTPAGYRGQSINTYMAELLEKAKTKRKLDDDAHSRKWDELALPLDPPKFILGPDKRVVPDLTPPEPNEKQIALLSEVKTQKEFTMSVEELAGYSVVVLDEVDKLVAGGDPEFKKQVQRELLRLLQGEEIKVATPDGETHTSLPTKNMLVLLSGAFVGLDKILAEYSKVGVGFGATVPEESNKTISELLAEYGIIPEMLGRIQHIIELDKLTEDDYLKILTEVEGSIVEKYEVLFDDVGLSLEFTDDALRELASLASKAATGARSLATLLARHVQPLLFDLVGESGTVTINKDLSHTFEEGE